MDAGHRGGRRGQAVVRQGQRSALKGVEDVGGDDGSLERSAQGHDPAGVVGEVQVVAKVECRVGDQTAHGVGDEDQSGLAFVDSVCTGGDLGAMAAPAGEVVPGGGGQVVGVGGDGQAPVVGEGQDGVAMGDGVLDRAEELVVRLEALEEGAPGGGLKQSARADAAVVTGEFVGRQLERVEPGAGEPGPGEPPAVR